MSTPEITLSVTDLKRQTFFNLLFGNSRGYVCLAFISGTKRESFSEQFYKYPEDMEKMLLTISHTTDRDIYFCPQLFTERKRKKYAIAATPNVWSDLDHCDPENLLVEPTVVIESSPGRYQGYWVLNQEFDQDDVENLSKRIAYRHAEQGADRSGWDLTQLLRVPYTPNFKYSNRPIVKPILAKNNKYSLKDFEELYPHVNEYKSIDVPEFSIPDNLDADDLLQSRSNRINPLIWGLYNDPPNEESWSEKLWKLLLYLFESGYDRAEVYTIATAAACNKYARDGRPALQLWKDVARAENKHNLQSKIAFASKNDLAVGQFDLLTEKERERVKSLPDSFVERYIKWASELTDAATQYHQAGALVCLSTILSGSIRLPSGYGTIVPNLWFMILADTTLTRKTTAMGVCTDLLEEINDDCIMGTDGSIEGMLTILSGRSNQPSIFLRDEFAGLIEQMNKKDYMSGMAELLTNLYDGKLQRRVLRKEIIEVRNPRLIMFTGGIRDAITGSLSYDNIASGFIPRFIFITAESDLKKVRPLGPPTEASVKKREKIFIELFKLNEYYNQEEMIVVPDSDSTITRKKFFDVTMDEDAWTRYNLLEAKMMEFGLSQQRAEIMTPVSARLSMSILKTAILIAASKSLTKNINITMEDLLRAISYGESWFTHTRAVVERVGIGASERKLEMMVKTIARSGKEGMHRMAIMNTFKLTKREFEMSFGTLEDRGIIRRTRVSRGEVITVVDDVDLRNFK